jgi:hypothetical protein
MSINAEISKKVIFSSIEEFWNYLRTRDEIKSASIELSSFYDTLFLAKFGCPCNTEELTEAATELYRQFDKIDKDTWNAVKKNIGCTNIIFQLDDENLFEL